MPFQVIVREIKPLDLAQAFAGLPASDQERIRAGTSKFTPNSGDFGQQIYEQQVEALDLGKVIAAVNHRKRERKPREAKAAAK